MKKIIIIFLLLLFFLQANAQQYPITSITISLPQNPDAITSNWNSSSSMLNISASAKFINGRINPSVMDSKILVIIKKAGSKICGNYSNKTAPSSNFNTAIKVWAGSNAVSLIGQDCTLQPGEYELSVQFFYDGPVGLVAISDEKIKAFTIKSKETITYQSPKLILPAHESQFSELEIIRPITFRWTPIVPKPNEPIIYKLRVWQLMQGQTSTQVIKSNTPIIEKEINDLTQANVVGIYTGPCKPPYMCDFVWNVQSLNREGKPIGENNGASELFSFKILANAFAEQCDCNKDVYVITNPGNQKIRCNETKVYDFGSTANFNFQNICSSNKCLSEWNAKIYNAQTGILVTTFNGNGNNTQFNLTLNSSAGYKIILQSNCNGKKCECTFWIRTKPNAERCECDNNSWGGLSYKVDKKQIKLSCEYKKVINWNCNQSFNFSNSYQCKPKDKNCNAKIYWTVLKDGNLFKSDSTSINNVIGNFTPDGKGKYVLDFSASCNGKKCSNCTYTFNVDECSSCLNDIIRNGEFVKGNQAGSMPSPGAVQFWSNWYGHPTVDNNPSEGFVEEGSVILNGNKISGQAIAQKLLTTNKIVAGKKYKVSIGVKFIAKDKKIDYARLRIVAFNDTTISNTNHPSPNSNITIIGRSGKIKDCGDWSFIELPTWTANKSFSNIAINAFTNDSLLASSVMIDDITICETTDGDCNEVQLDANNNPITPNGYGNVPSGFACQAEAEEDEYYNGTLQDLYPNYNGTTDIYNQISEDCNNIGGTIPNGADNFNCDSLLQASGINMTCDEFQNLLNNRFDFVDSIPISLPSISSIKNNVCDRPTPQNYANMPFHGRDIIYIHGLQMDHIIDRSIGYNGAFGNATGTWPSNANEYYNNNGYYKIVGVANMQPHIQHFLRGNGNLNRYIVVVYDCSQSAKVAINAVLTQIREAMVNGIGVQSDQSDPRGKNCFGREFIMISHSTGALIADVALSIANKTKTDNNLKGQWGDIGLISDRCKGRVSIQGAYSGSNLAKIACITAVTHPALFTIAVEAIARAPLTLSTLNALSNTQQNILNSILVDLVPEITRARWANYINDINIPVFTLAGGHPSAILGPLKYPIHSGFDDGVLSIDCANGNNNPLIYGPSSFFANPFKVFDMGIPKIRAIEYFLDRKRNIPGLFASASNQYLSPTGMVEPNNIVLTNPQNHFNNHYSFIQSSKDHWFNTTELGSGNLPCDYGRTEPGGYTNNEEQLVVNNASLYNPNLIDPSIISQMAETRKGQYIEYPWIKVVMRRGLPRITVFWKRFYIWKRTYHNLIDNCTYDVDYAYKYLFKQ